MYFDASLTNFLALVGSLGSWSSLKYSKSGLIHIGMVVFVDRDKNRDKAVILLASCWTSFTIWRTLSKALQCSLVVVDLTTISSTYPSTPESWEHLSQAEVESISAKIRKYVIQVENLKSTKYILPANCRGSDCVNPRYGNGQTFDDCRKNLRLIWSIILESETESVRNRVSLSLRLAETVSDSPLPRANRLSLCRERVDILHKTQDRLRLGQARPYSLAAYYRRSPIRVSQWHYPHQLSSSEATSALDAMSLLEKRVTQATQGSKIGKPKSVRGDRLGFQRTLVDLILNAQATGELGQMENNDRILKELATPNMVYQPWRRPPQALGIPRGLLYNEAAGDTRGLHQNEGLSMMDISMIDVASEGALMDKTPAAARHLISNMASNTQQFGIRGPSQSRMVNEIGAASNQRLENQLTKLTSLVRQLAVGQHQPAMAA
ncbi:hypothetical protein CR513_06916, partial [Mucuna pruriens]